MSSESKANIKAMAYIAVAMAIVWTVAYSGSWMFGYEIPQTSLVIGGMAYVSWLIAFIYATLEHFILFARSIKWEK